MSHSTPSPLGSDAPAGSHRAFVIVNRDRLESRLVDTLHAPDPRSAVSMARAMYGGELLTAYPASALTFPFERVTDVYPGSTRWVVLFATPFPLHDPRWEEYARGEVRAPDQALATRLVRERFPVWSFAPLVFSRCQSLLSYRADEPRRLGGRI